MYANACRSPPPRLSQDATNGISGQSLLPGRAWGVGLSRLSLPALCPLGLPAHPHMNQVDTLNLSRKKKEGRTLARVGSKPKRRPLAASCGPRRHRPDCLSCDCNVRMGCPACPASCKGPALSYIPPSLRAAASSIRTVQSDCAARTVRNSSWSIEASKKRTGSRLPPAPQPTTARAALPLSEQTNILAFNTGAPTSYPHI